MELSETPFTRCLKDDLKEGYTSIPLAGKTAEEMRELFSGRHGFVMKGIAWVKN